MIYHITSQSNWEAALAKGRYDFDSLATEGFIHCSKREQVLGVANRIFVGRRDLVLLEIDESKLDARLVYENLEGGTEDYPHIYGPLNLDAVVAVLDFRPGPDGQFC